MPDLITVAATDTSDWVLVKEGSRRKIPEIVEIPYVPRPGETDEFDVCLTEDELESLKDGFGDVRYEKVHDFLLPRIDGIHYYEWLAARMRNYMIRLIRHEGYKPQYYNPAKHKEIQAHHVARYFGIELCRMLRGWPTYEEVWSTRESLFEIGVCTESMPLGAIFDLNRCMHFVDDWEEDDDEDWETIYPDARRVSPDVGTHRSKFCIVEDAFNQVWVLHITFGRDLTFDESRIAG